MKISPACQPTHYLIHHACRCFRGGLNKHGVHAIIHDCSPKKMSTIQDEMLRRFPDASKAICLDGTDGDYLAAAELAGWVASGGVDPQAPDQVARLRAFAEWCCSQPKGKSADDDIGTIYMVGFLETLCGSPSAPALIPLILDRDYFVASANYFRRWVGDEEYANILKSRWR